MKQKPNKHYSFGFDFAKWSAALLMLVFFRPKRHYPFGKPEAKGRILVSSNHVGPLDCVKIGCIFPWRRFWTITRQECFTTKFSNWVFRAINCLPVDRENLSMDTYHTILSLLKNEKMVLFFSEGRLNFTDNNVKDYKMGTAFFAAMANTPIVPVYIVRREKFWKRTDLIVGKEIVVSDYFKGMPSIAEIETINEIVRQKACELEEWKNEYLGK